MGISPRDFAQLQARLAAPRRGVADEAAPVRPRAGRRVELVILGVDPSLRGTGFGVIRAGAEAPVLLTCGTIVCPPAWARSRCLARIAGTLREVVTAEQPAVAAVEGLFHAQNLRTALIMGEARGAALAVLAEAGLEIFELAPRKVKQAIVGYGAAQKLAVAKMVQRMLNLAELPAPDAADALALALACAHETGRAGLGGPKRI